MTTEIDGGKKSALVIHPCLLLVRFFSEHAIDMNIPKRLHSCQESDSRWLLLIRGWCPLASCSSSIDCNFLPLRSSKTTSAPEGEFPISDYFSCCYQRSPYEGMFLQWPMPSDARAYCVSGGGRQEIGFHTGQSIPSIQSAILSKVLAAKFFCVVRVHRQHK